MHAKVPVICGGMLFGAALLLGLPGCGPTEDLIVPPRSAMSGKVLVREVYSLPRPTVMVAMSTGSAQPEIHLPYDKKTDGPPPAEAFERVPFDVTAEEQEWETDPNNPTGPQILVTESVSGYWGPVTLDAGTQISISSAEFYSNSHVYRGRVLTGFAHNSFILLVVPNGDSNPPTVPALQARDQGYLVPLRALPPTTMPTTPH